MGMREHKVRLPSGFAAELIAVACLGADHLGGHNAGHDLVTDTHGRVEVKSCRVTKPGALEFVAKPGFTTQTDYVVLVTTSRSVAETTATACRRGEEIVIESTSVIRGDNGPVRAYLIKATELDRLGTRYSETGAKARWHVDPADCEELEF